MVSHSNHFNVDSNRFSEIQGDGYYEIHLKDAYKGSVTSINLIAQKPGSCFAATLIAKYEYTSSKLVNIHVFCIASLTKGEKISISLLQTDN